MPHVTRNWAGGAPVVAASSSASQQGAGPPAALARTHALAGGAPVQLYLAMWPFGPVSSYRALGVVPASPRITGVVG